MTTDPKIPAEPESTSTPHVHELTPTPAPHGYLCSDCIAPTPALEVHMLGDGTAVAYCARCAPTWRQYAHVVLSADLAHGMGITLPITD